MRKAICGYYVLIVLTGFISHGFTEDAQDFNVTSINAHDPVGPTSQSTKQISTVTISSTQSGFESVVLSVNGSTTPDKLHNENDEEPTDASEESLSTATSYATTLATTRSNDATFPNSITFTTGDVPMTTEETPPDPDGIKFEYTSTIHSLSVSFYAEPMSKPIQKLIFLLRTNSAAGYEEQERFHSRTTKTTKNGNLQDNDRNLIPAPDSHRSPDLNTYQSPDPNTDQSPEPNTDQPYYFDTTQAQDPDPDTDHVQVFDQSRDCYPLYNKRQIFGHSMFYDRELTCNISFPNNGTVTFSELLPTSHYSLNISAVYEDSHPVILIKKSLCTDPSPPKDIHCRLQSYTQMVINITRSPVMVEYKIIPTNSVNSGQLSIAKYSATIFQVTNFTEDSIYEFNVTADYCDKSSSPTVITCKTTALPTEVRNFRNTSLKPTLVKFEWDEPAYTNGYLVGYEIIFSQGDDQAGNPYLVSGGETTFTLNREKKIKAGQTYVFKIAAKNHLGNGTWTFLNVTVPIYAPRLEKNHSPYERTGITNSTDARIFISNPFSDDHGPIDNYSVIVSNNRQVNCLPQTISRFPDYPYYAIFECTDFFLESKATCGPGHHSIYKENTWKARLRLGVEDSCSNSNTDVIACNGKLKPQSTVYLTIMACNEAGCTCSHRGEPITTQAAPSNANLTAMLCLSVIIALLLCGTAIVIICRKTLISKFLTPVPSASIMKMKKEPSNRRVVASKPIPTLKFTEILKELSRDSGLKFSEDFEDLKNVGRSMSCEQAEIQGNRSKNRFANILPYDATRVKLLPTEDEECSDYINANWVPGYHSKREYIATQGPMPATKDDFWRMLWEYNCPSVVMLTLCVEKNRTKCDMYWPVDQDPILYGDLEVSLLNETISSEWHIREFQLKTSNQTRTLKHFHYLEWPDMNVPKASSLLQFVRTVRDKIGDGPLNGPIVVHCSAGVGRSGTFIALDTILEQLKIPHAEGEEQVIDIYGVVYKLRQSRVLMVQTEQQYIFLYECIKRVLEKTDSRLSFFQVTNSRNCTDVNAELSPDQRNSTGASVVDDDTVSEEETMLNNEDECVVEVEQDTTKACDEKEDEGIFNNEDL